MTPLSFFFSLELAGPTAPVTPLSSFFSLEVAGPTAPVTPQVVSLSSVVRSSLSSSSSSSSDPRFRHRRRQ